MGKVDLVPGLRVEPLELNMLILFLEFRHVNYFLHHNIHHVPENQ
jgi:hypothetical protein